MPGGLIGGGGGGAHAGAGGGVGDPELFAELWRACAGPLVEVPQRDERVFYFLQGHLEQVLALPLAAAEFFGFCPSILAGSERVMMTRFLLLLLLFVQLQEPTDPALLAEQIKMFQVPYKILCKVVNVELKVISLSLSLRCGGAKRGGKRKGKGPREILLRFLVCLWLQAETETDEVFAQITLQPDPDVSGDHHRFFFFFFVVLLSPPLMVLECTLCCCPVLQSW